MKEEINFKKAYKALVYSLDKSYPFLSEVSLKSSLTIANKKDTKIQRAFLEFAKSFFQNLHKNFYQYGETTPKESRLSCTQFYKNVDILEKCGLPINIGGCWKLSYDLIGKFVKNAATLIHEIRKEPSERIKDIYYCSSGMRSLSLKLRLDVDRVGVHKLIERKALPQFTSSENFYILIYDTIKVLLNHQFVIPKGYKYYEKVFGKDLVKLVKEILAF